MGGFFRSVPTSTFVVLAAWMATVNPSQADTGTMILVFDKAAALAGFGVGYGKLWLHGKGYPFKISGVSFGATLAVTSTQWKGRAQNIRAPSDLAGDYSAVGAALPS